MLNESAFQLGIILGKKAFMNNKIFYKDVYNTLETEDDALEVMLNCWLAEELMIDMFYGDLDFNSMRAGWAKGFLDSLFPMRAFC
jgi:hypothetical protein